MAPLFFKTVATRRAGGGEGDRYVRSGAQRFHGTCNGAVHASNSSIRPFVRVAYDVAQAAERAIETSEAARNAATVMACVVRGFSVRESAFLLHSPSD